MQIKLNNGTYDDCSIKICKYPNNRPALVLYHEGEILLIATVNMPDVEIPDGYVCIKDWSENEGILTSLIENKIIKPPKFHIPTEYVNISVCKLKKIFIKLILRNNYERKNSSLYIMPNSHCYFLGKYLDMDC